MRSIERIYKKIAKQNPNLGAHPCLAQAVKGKHFTRKSLVPAFKKIMPKDEYDVTDTKALIDHLMHLTNITRKAKLD